MRRGRKGAGVPDIDAQQNTEQQGADEVLMLDENKYNRVRSQVIDLINAANGLLNYLEEWHMEVEPSQVLKWTRTPGKVHEAVLDHELGGLKNMGERMRSFLVEQMKGNARMIPSCSVPDYCFSMVTYNEDLRVFLADDEAIRKPCIVKLQPTEAATLRKLQKATDLLNEVFGEDAPLAWWTIWNRSDVDRCGGKLVLSEQLPWTYLFKTWAGTFDRGDIMAEQAR